jgi:hypothetical protein
MRLTHCWTPHPISHVPDVCVNLPDHTCPAPWSEAKTVAAKPPSHVQHELIKVVRPGQALVPVPQPGPVSGEGRYYEPQLEACVPLGFATAKISGWWAPGWISQGPA